MPLFIVRHAETEDNARRIFQVPDVALSGAGRAQAQKLAERIESMGIVRILASDFARTLETAAYLRARTGVAIETEVLLRERNFGDLRGSSYAALQIDPFAAEYTPPGGESWAAFHERVDRAWLRIRGAAAETPGNLLVMTHGLVCRALVERQLHLLPDVRLPARWDNTALTEVDAAPPWTVRRVNCMAHLRDAGLSLNPHGAAA